VQMPIPAKPERRLMPTGRVRLKERKMDRRTIFDAWTGACSSGALVNINELSPAEAQGIARMTVKEFETMIPGRKKYGSRKLFISLVPTRLCAKWHNSRTC